MKSGTFAGALVLALGVAFAPPAQAEQSQGVKRHAARLDVSPGEPVVTGGAEGIEADLVTHENVKAG